METPDPAPASSPTPDAPPPPLVLTRDAILGRRRPPPMELVQVPELEAGAAVWVRGLTGTERDEWELGIYELVDREAERLKAAGAKPDPWYLSRNLRARLAVRTVCGPDGTLLFKPEDAEELGRQPSPALDRIFTVAKRLSRIEQSDVDELVGKSAGGRSSAPGTA